MSPRKLKVTNVVVQRENMSSGSKVQATVSVISEHIYVKKTAVDWSIYALVECMYVCVKYERETKTKTKMQKIFIAELHYNYSCECN